VAVIRCPHRNEARIDAPPSSAAAAARHADARAPKFIGVYTAVPGGQDALVFTAGSSENSASLRAASWRQLAWLGVQLDEHANDSGRPRISTADSGVSVWVIPTDEELMIANYTLALVRPGAPSARAERT
jgi:acetate kinase